MKITNLCKSRLERRLLSFRPLGRKSAMLDTLCLSRWRDHFLKEQEFE